MEGKNCFSRICLTVISGASYNKIKEMLNMLSAKEARILASEKCIQMFGKEFCDKYAEFGGSAYNELEDSVECTFGMNDEVPEVQDRHRLTEVKYKYYLCLKVSRIDGSIKVMESCLPSA